MQKFNLHSSEDWLERIKKELPEGLDISSLMVNSSLFQHSGFANPQNKVIGHISYPSWLICAELESPDNQLILEALSNGAESVYLSINEETNFEELLSEVRIDYITSLFDFRSSTSVKVDELKIYLTENYSLSDLNLYTFGFKDICNSIVLDYDTLDTNDKLTQFCQDVYEIVKNEDETLIINYRISPNFYDEVSKLRAIKILINNILENCHKTNKYFLFARPQEKNRDFNQNLIRWSIQGLSSLIGGADFLSFKKWTEKEKNEARLAQNIQHLYKEEASLESYGDSMAGSFFIEDTTEQIVKSVWENFINQ